MSENQDKKMFLPFRVDEYQFAVSTAEVESIVEFSEFRSVPLTPESFLGVFSYRNEVVSLISLKRKFGIAGDTNSGSIILTKMESSIVGFHVDEIYKLIYASDTIRTKISSYLSFGCFSNILLHGNKMLIETTFELLFNITDLPISITKNINSKPTIKREIENSAKSKFESVENREIQNAVKNSNSTSNLENNKVNDTIKNASQFEHKIGKKHKKYQNIKKRSTQIEDSFQPELKIGQSGKNNKLTPVYLWMLLLIVILLIVAGVYLFNKKDKLSEKKEYNKIISQTTENKKIKPKKTIKKSYYKSLPDSKSDKPIKESKEVTAIVKTKIIKQPLENIPEKIKDNELAMYTRNKKEEWVKIEKKEQNNSNDINQLNKIRERDVRIETNEFTLIIERQKLKETGPSSQVYGKSSNINHTVYIVIPGDTLWHLSERFLGNPFWYKVLADSSMIKNPDLIYPGDKIHIIKKE